jgi:putative endonuclease
MYFVYILRSELNGSYYRGQTKDLGARLKRHNSRLEKSTARYVPWILVWSCQKASRSEAVILERKLKHLSVKRLEEFIKKYSDDIGPDDANKKFKQ